jgi:alcohol dehydrogenase class IV
MESWRPFLDVKQMVNKAPKALKPVEIRFELALPSKVRFGWGLRREIGDHAAPLGRRVFFLLGSQTLVRSGVVAEAVSDLKRSGLEVVDVGVISREPEVSDVDALVHIVRSHRVGSQDVVVVMGGGSAMDAGKAVAGLATQPEFFSVRDYLEGVGSGRKMSAQPLPVLAIPTTAGTGSEATKNSVISSRDPPFKKSFRDERLVSKTIIIDPELTVSNSPEVTAASGMDAITQLMESYISRKSHVLTQSLVEGALPGCFAALRRAFGEPTNRPAREQLAYAAFISGVALAHSGLGLAHGVAAALGCRLGVSHGRACATMLPIALETNADTVPGLIQRLAEIALGRAFPTAEIAAESLIDEIRALQEDLNIPQRLSQYGVTLDNLHDLAHLSQGSSMNGNPRSLTEPELALLLTRHL